MDRSRRAVVVGVDGSAPARLAVRWAAREAGLRNAPLRLVHAWRSTFTQVPLAPPPRGVSDAEPKTAGQEILGIAMREALDEAPGLDVDQALVQGDPAAVVLRQADDAQMIVLGDRGLGGFAGLMLGSVAVHIGVRARSPVVIVRGDAERDRPVVVGVDGSEPSDAALEFAFDEAELRRAQLIAVHAWAYPAAVGVDLPWGFDGDAAERHARTVLDEAVERWADKHAAVSVERRLLPMTAGAALVEASQDAALLIVGSRGHGALRRMLLGSVSHALIHHSHCPVVVLRPAFEHAATMAAPPSDSSGE